MFKEIKLPPRTEIEFGGLYQMQRESFLGLTQVLLGSILLIFIILVFEFRSFSHPIAILVATILCGSGALLALLRDEHDTEYLIVHGRHHGGRHRPPRTGILMLDAEKHFSGLGYDLRDAIFPCWTASTPADSHDSPGHHIRHAAAGVGRRLRRTDAAAARHRGDRRGHGFHGPVAIDHTGSVLPAPQARAIGKEKEVYMELRFLPLGRLRVLRRILPISLCWLLAQPGFPQQSQADSSRTPSKKHLVFDSSITLPSVHGGFDLMAVDLDRQRLFVSAENNHTVEVADLKARKPMASHP